MLTEPLISAREAGFWGRKSPFDPLFQHPFRAHPHPSTSCTFSFAGSISPSPIRDASDTPFISFGATSKSSRAHQASTEAGRYPATIVRASFTSESFPPLGPFRSKMRVASTTVRVERIRTKNRASSASLTPVSLWNSERFPPIRIARTSGRHRGSPAPSPVPIPPGQTYRWSLRP